MIVTTELQAFERRTFRVKAVQVTKRNMREIAEWTGGSYTFPEHGAPFITIPCGEKRENLKAYTGSWVTSLIGDERNFRVYQNHTFLQAFQEIMNEANKYARVHELLLNVARAQDSATYHNDSSGDVILLVEKTAREICSFI